jgi:hypothetical protein
MTHFVAAIEITMPVVPGTPGIPQDLPGHRLQAGEWLRMGQDARR